MIKRAKRKNKNEIIKYIIFLSVVLIIITLLIFTICINKKNYNNNKTVYISNIKIKKPIVPITDNDYYLKHNFYKEDKIQGAVCLDYHTNKKSKIKKEIQEKEKQDKVELDDINKLQKNYNNNEINKTLYISNTQIKEPIVQATDNDYYLKHNLYKEEEIQGAVFLDYRTKINEGRKNLIYSHNSHKMDVPFKELEKYYDKSFYEEHKYIYLKSENETAKYEVFSVYIETEDWNYTNIDFKNDSTWLNHINTLKEKSLYDTNVKLNKKDKILILQTCSNLEEYENFENKYLLIISKKIKMKTFSCKVSKFKTKNVKCSFLGKNNLDKFIKIK